MVVRKPLDVLPLAPELWLIPAAVSAFINHLRSLSGSFKTFHAHKIKGLWAHATSFLLFRNKILHVNTRRKITLYPIQYIYFESNFALSGHDESSMTSRTEVLVFSRTFQMNGGGNRMYSFVFLDFIQRNVL